MCKSWAQLFYQLLEVIPTVQSVMRRRNIWCGLEGASFISGLQRMETNVNQNLCISLWFCSQGWIYDLFITRTFVSLILESLTSKSTFSGSSIHYMRSYYYLLQKKVFSANSTLSCMRISSASRLGEVIPPLYSTQVRRIWNAASS